MLHFHLIQNIGCMQYFSVPVSWLRLIMCEIFHLGCHVSAQRVLGSEFSTEGCTAYTYLRRSVWEHSGKQIFFHLT